MADSKRKRRKRNRTDAEGENDAAKQSFKRRTRWDHPKLDNTSDRDPHRNTVGSNEVKARGELERDIGSLEANVSAEPKEENGVPKRPSGRKTRWDTPKLDGASYRGPDSSTIAAKMTEAQGELEHGNGSMEAILSRDGKHQFKPEGGNSTLSLVSSGDTPLTPTTPTRTWSMNDTFKDVMARNAGFTNTAGKHYMPGDWFKTPPLDDKGSARSKPRRHLVFARCGSYLFCLMGFTYGGRGISGLCDSLQRCLLRYGIAWILKKSRNGRDLKGGAGAFPPLRLSQGDAAEGDLATEAMLSMVDVDVIHQDELTMPLGYKLLAGELDRAIELLNYHTPNLVEACHQRMNEFEETRLKLPDKISSTYQPKKAASSYPLTPPSSEISSPIETETAREGSSKPNLLGIISHTQQETDLSSETILQRHADVFSNTDQYVRILGGQETLPSMAKALRAMSARRHKFPHTTQPASELPQNSSAWPRTQGQDPKGDGQKEHSSGDSPDESSRRSTRRGAKTNDLVNSSAKMVDDATATLKTGITEDVSKLMGRDKSTAGSPGGR